MRTVIAALSLLTALAAAAPQALECGVATSNFPACPECLQTILDTTPMKFWWNWDTHPKIDTFGFTPAQKQAMLEKFVPMVWGNGVPDDDWAFLNSSATHVLGFNEPDQYGPACVGGWNPPAYGCAPGEYRSATSSGWFPLFDPSTGNTVQPHAARLWQWSVNNMTVGNPTRNGTVSKIVSPSMAQGAAAGPSCIGVDPSIAGNIKTCPGWLNVFKSYTMNLSCTSFAGEATNCWDVIDSIQIHAYAKDASDVHDKLLEYASVFADDFAGTNGRTKKTLWLTEVACGSSNGTEITAFVDDLMNAQTGLTNRDKFGFVERVSWFSDWSFGSFKVGNVSPRKYETWSSTLFDPFGPLSPVGKHFFSYCS